MTGRVLVVDDTPQNVKLLEVRLTREYYDVITAASGAEAIKAIEVSQPDIILLDVMMPEMDGFEVCRRVKQNPATAHIPIVMVTSLTDRADRVRGLESGADDFLSKPARDVILFARIRSLVRLKRAMDEWRLRETSRGLAGSINMLAAKPSAPATASILVVDDSPHASRMISTALQEDGHVVTVCATGKEAQERVENGSFDVIIVSLLLQQEDGLRLCSALRSGVKSRHTPILAVVDEDDADRIAKSLEIGANDCILTPVDKAELLARTRTQVRVHQYQENLRASYEISLSLALTDELTGIYNRHYLTAHLATLLTQTGASGKPLALMMIDVDLFKRINDEHGHDVGDAVLREIATRLMSNLRSFDTVARFGGDEFVVVMPSCSEDEAIAAGERLRARVSDRPILLGRAPHSIQISISVGIAQWQGEGDSDAALLKRADDALYAAKREGRNKVAGMRESAQRAVGAN
jgi:two-component system cell cycle response regulator